MVSGSAQTDEAPQGCRRMVAAVSWLSAAAFWLSWPQLVLQLPPLLPTAAQQLHLQTPRWLPADMKANFPNSEGPG